MGFFPMSISTGKVEFRYWLLVILEEYLFQCTVFVPTVWPCQDGYPSIVDDVADLHDPGGKVAGILSCGPPVLSQFGPLQATFTGISPSVKGL